MLDDVLDRWQSSWPKLLPITPLAIPTLKDQPTTCNSPGSPDRKRSAKAAKLRTWAAAVATMATSDHLPIGRGFSCGRGFPFQSSSRIGPTPKMAMGVSSAQGPPRRSPEDTSSGMMRLAKYMGLWSEALSKFIDLIRNDERIGQ